MISNKPVEDVTWPDIEELVSESAEESQRLDFKRQLPGQNHSSKRDFLRDVCAFANSGGGDIVFGIDEQPDGVAGSILPIPPDQIDKEILRLQSLILSTIEPHLPVDIQPVKNGDGNAVVIFRIRASVARPHSVLFQGHRHFTGRRTRGIDDLSMEEIRDLFSGGDAQSERVRAFRKERLWLLDEYTRPPGHFMPRLKGKGRLFMHVIPLETFGQRGVIPVDEMRRDYGEWLPGPQFAGMVSSALPRPNLEGLLIMGTLLTDTPDLLCWATVQVFHNGIVEIAAGDLILGKNGFSPPRLNELIRVALGRVVARLDVTGKRLGALGLRGKLAVFVSLYDLDQSRPFDMPIPTQLADHIYPVDRREMLLPEVIADTSDLLMNSSPAMSDLSNMLWQALGLDPRR